MLGWSSIWKIVGGRETKWLVFHTSAASLKVWKQALPLWGHKNAYGHTKVMQTDIQAPCQATNAQNSGYNKRPYKFVPLFCGGHLFALRWESVGSPGCPCSSASPAMCFWGFRGPILHTLGIPIPKACRIGCLKPWEYLPAFPHLQRRPVGDFVGTCIAVTP